MFEGITKFYQSGKGLQYRLRSQWLLATIMWAVISLPYFFANKPESFQAAGSIIVILSVILFARRHSEYASAAEQFRHNHVIMNFNRLEEKRIENELRTEITFNSYLQQISQISSFIDVPNPIGPNTRDEILKLAQHIDTIKPNVEEQIRISLLAEKAANDAAADYKEFHEHFDPWTKLMDQLQLTFAIIGTFQWGYGNQLVEFWFSLGE